ncbi:BRCA1-associated protein [Microdochium nivale]|nr:BRCA1-associated protein [Microdochium nivale]
MPLYFYHIKFELYSSQDPTAPEQSHPLSSGSYRSNIWLPGRTANIFSDLPLHPQQSVTQLARSPPAKPTLRASARAVLPSVGAALGTEHDTVIDCGSPRPSQSHSSINITRLGLRERTLSFPPPPSDAAIKPQTAANDWRFGPVRITSIDSTEANGKTSMTNTATSPSVSATAFSTSTGVTGRATKAKFVPSLSKNTNVGWGIVHLYRESHENPELANLAIHAEDGDGQEQSLDALIDDCTTLCIPAVPSYLSPSDFLGFIGDKWRDQVSHYRMVMTGRMNRYLVLLKFRSSKRAQQFKNHFDGRVFTDIEPETCNVAFIRSVTFETPAMPNGSFPDLSQDPFTPSDSLKPFPPPTSDLMELPTCPVCLERMDDTTGLLTIPCQHVFHCSCLQKWKGSGCPVCRHTNPSDSRTQRGLATGSQPASTQDASDSKIQPFGSHVSNLCSTCDSPDDLWICLICGSVGCGRYKGGHAKEHWKDTAHTFALELMTQHVWDYAGDMWVHRLIRDKGDGKVVELPGRHPPPNSEAANHQQANTAEAEEVVPRSKLENIGLEYTHLLTSQLESQRVYFEEMLNKAADKAAKAAAAAEAAAEQASEATKELRILRAENQTLRIETLPLLEKDIERERMRSAKATDLSRALSKTLQEEKKVSEGLMKRIEHINKEVEALGVKVAGLAAENADLKDQNHDLTMFISGQEKLRQLEAEGGLEEGEVQEGSASVPEDVRRQRRKGKGKGK